jgi:integrase
VGEVVRLSGGAVTLQDAVEAFLDHHDLARSTRRVYRASLASLAAALGPATAVGELSGPLLAGDPTGDLVRGRERIDRTRALTRRQLERLFARRDLPLRSEPCDGCCETAARANELLALDVEDLDLANRRARVRTRPQWRRPGPTWPTWTCAAPMTCGTPSPPGWRTPPSPPA